MWTNRYAIEIGKDSKDIHFIGNSRNYFKYDLIKDNINIISTIDKYQQYNRTIYNEGGYSELDNWFIKKDKFISSYESNCVVNNFNDLFIPHSNKNTIINTNNVSNPYLKIIITFPTPVTVLLMGCVINNIQNGTFRKANIKIFNNNEIKIDKNYFNNPTKANEFKAVYFTGFENYWKNENKIEILLNDYIGTDNVIISSIFGKIYSKEISYLNNAGGDVYGILNIKNEGKILLNNKPFIINKIISSNDELTDEYAIGTVLPYNQTFGTNVIKTMNYWGKLYPQNIKYPITKPNKKLISDIQVIEREYYGYVSCFDLEDGKMYYYSLNNKWTDCNGNNINAKKLGTTQQRPTDVKAGFYYFDTTLNKPIWKKDDISEDWVDATGAKV